MQVVINEPYLPDLNMTQVQILSGEDDEPRLFTVLDDAVYYIEDDSDYMTILLPSLLNANGYREPF